MQEVTAVISCKFSVTPENFLSSVYETASEAGVTANGGYTMDVRGASQIFTRVLLPANADKSTNSGTGNEAFQYGSFPAIENDTTATPQTDFNGLPLDFTTLKAIVFRVKLIDPDDPNGAGGTVKITTGGTLIPGDTFQVHSMGPGLLLLQLDDGWDPSSGAFFQVEWVPGTAATAAEVNLLVEVLIIGNPAP